MATGSPFIWRTRRTSSISILACVKLGVIFVPVNILYRERELSHILSDAEPKLLVTEKELPSLRAEAATQAVDLPEVPLDGESPAALVYTSGTTGVSKGAILTHNNFAVNAASLMQAWRISSADRFLWPCPCFTCTRSATVCTAGYRGLPDAPLGAIRARKSRRRISGFPADPVFWRADGLRSPA